MRRVVAPNPGVMTGPAEISEKLAGTLKIEVVLPRILESLFKIFPQADRGFVVLKDPAGGELHVKALRTRSMAEFFGSRCSFFCAAKNSTFSRFGGRARHVGRQKIPVVRTPSQNTPSYDESLRSETNMNTTASTAKTATTTTA